MIFKFSPCLIKVQLDSCTLIFPSQSLQCTAAWGGPKMMEEHPFQRLGQAQPAHVAEPPGIKVSLEGMYGWRTRTEVLILALFILR